MPLHYISSSSTTYLRSDTFPLRLQSVSSFLVAVSGLMGSRIKLRDGRYLAYRQGGVPKEDAKHKIIIVHGFRSSKNMKFSASKELMEELGVCFLIYDRAGYGESDKNVERSVESEVDDITELADQLEIGPKFYLIGTSMGSYPTWGCLKHIPHRLSGVAFVGGAVNYRWPSLPEKLIENDYRRVFIKWSLWILKYKPRLLHWWVLQKIFLSTVAVCERIGVPMLTKNTLPESDILDTLRDDFMTCFGQWDFEPADLSISRESSVHIWHGTEDTIVPVQLPRCILEKQPLINYHEIPQAGHLVMLYDGIPDEILRSLFLGEEQKLYGLAIRKFDLCLGLKV